MTDSGTPSASGPLFSWRFQVGARRSASRVGWTLPSFCRGRVLKGSVTDIDGLVVLGRFTLRR
jgi:hypothetical protein